MRRPVDWCHRNLRVICLTEFEVSQFVCDAAQIKLITWFNLQMLGDLLRAIWTVCIRK